MNLANKPRYKYGGREGEDSKLQSCMPKKINSNCIELRIDD